MSFKHLQVLTAKPALKEGQFDLPHPSLSKAELLRLQAKFQTLAKHVEAIEALLAEVDHEMLDDSDEAIKMHHAGHKAGLDMGAWDDTKQKFNAFASAADDLEMHWMSSIQAETDPEMKAPPADDDAK